MAAPRAFEQRKTDSLAHLAASEADAWVATASPDGVAHMVPLSIGWTGAQIVLVTEARSVTARNLASSKRARLGIGGTRDVVMILAELAADQALLEAPASLADAFAAQSGWDPRGDSNAADYRLLELRPLQIQAWREANEIAGRTLMKSGEWI